MPGSGVLEGERVSYKEAIEVQVREYPPAAVAPPELLPPPTPIGPAPIPPRPRKPRSALGRIVLSVALLAIGVVGVIDLAGVDVLASVYVAVPLAVVGLGLVAGAWYGRAPGLIAVGAVLSVVLVIVGSAERISVRANSATWRPTTMAQLDNTYSINIGSALLDLSALDFKGRSESVKVDVSVGDLTIIVPATVDVTAKVGVDVGDATVFGTSWGGLGADQRTISDNGVDGPGGGNLTIQATVDVGNVEVRR
jgi:hypothetical protein